MKLSKVSDSCEFERIATLPNGIRTAKVSMQKATYVFCEASDPNRPHIKGHQQLFLVDSQREVISRDMPLILGAINTDSNLPAAALPKNHNTVVMRVKALVYRRSRASSS